MPIDFDAFYTQLLSFAGCLLFGMFLGYGVFVFFGLESYRPDDE